MAQHPDELPRRNRIDQFTPAERLIWTATNAVEEAGAHPALTDAVILLGRARDRVADFVDGVPDPGPEAQLDAICHPEQLQVWSAELLDAVAPHLREDLASDDVIYMHRMLQREIRRIVALALER